MNDDTCRVVGCEAPIHVKKRQLCTRHYQAAWHSGKLDDVNIWRHTITSYDSLEMVGDCSACGPGVRVFIRRGRANCTPSARQSKMSSRHGLTRAAIDLALEQCGRACEICRDQFTETNPACVDHDHDCCPRSSSCGQCVRGLLCRRCNAGIGMLRENPKIIMRALEYLDQKKLPLTIRESSSEKL